MYQIWNTVHGRKKVVVATHETLQSAIDRAKGLVKVLRESKPPMSYSVEIKDVETNQVVWRDRRMVVRDEW
jgi:hypothetical protein